MKPVIKLVAIAKNEAFYIPAWVHHHFSIGVDFIEIHVNDSDDNSLEICEAIKEFDDRFDYIDSSRLLQESIDSGESFQCNAYNKSLGDVRHGGEVITHVLMLDIDEYLVSRAFDGDLKDLIVANSSVDVFSFLWYSDDYGKRGRCLKHPFTDALTIYRMNHVKSMAKIGDSLLSCSHHNFKFSKDFCPVNQFSSLSGVRLSDDLNTTLGRSVLRREFLDSLDSARPESWFVLHCIYKSEVEYLASLCRGDRCNNSSEPLKQNRWGLRPFPGYPASPFLFQVARDKIKVYRNSYLSFVMASGLLERLKLARRFVVERSSRLAALLQEQPGLMDSFSRCFLGTRYQSATCAGRDQLRNRRSVEFFDASRFYLSRPDVLSAHGHSAPRDEVAYVHALNEFYGFDRSLLSDFTLAEFGYWHTRFFARKYEENGKSADFWMRKNPIP